MGATQHTHRAKNTPSRRQTQGQKLPLAWILGGVMGAILLFLVVTASSGTPLGGLPDFTAQTLTGETVQLSDYRGQVVMLNFWATWCPPCRAEMPAIQEAYERYQSQGFVVLAINNAEDEAKIAPFARSLGLNFPIVLDETQTLQRKFSVTGYPMSLFIGADGKPYATHSGMLNEQQLDTYVQQGLSALN